MDRKWTKSLCVLLFCNTLWLYACCVYSKPIYWVHVQVVHHLDRQRICDYLIIAEGFVECYWCESNVWIFTVLCCVILQRFLTFEKQFFLECACGLTWAHFAWPWRAITCCKNSVSPLGTWKHDVMFRRQQWTMSDFDAFSVLVSLQVICFIRRHYLSGGDFRVTNCLFCCCLHLALYRPVDISF